MSCEEINFNIIITCGGEKPVSLEEQLRGVNLDYLKKLLKYYEQIEEYEKCRLVQNEINSRVNAVL